MNKAEPHILMDNWLHMLDTAGCFKIFRIFFNIIHVLNFSPFWCRWNCVTLQAAAQPVVWFSFSSRFVFATSSRQS